MFREVGRLITKFQTFEKTEAELSNIKNKDKAEDIHCAGQRTYAPQAPGHDTRIFVPAGDDWPPAHAPRLAEPRELMKFMYQMETVDIFAPMILNINNVNKFVPVQKYYYDVEANEFKPLDLWEVHYLTGAIYIPDREYGGMETTIELIKPFNIRELR